MFVVEVGGFLCNLQAPRPIEDRMIPALRHLLCLAVALLDHTIQDSNHHKLLLPTHQIHEV